MGSDFLHAVVRHVADGYMVPRCRFEVDVVDAHAVTHDHFELRQSGEHPLRKRRVLVDDGFVALQVADQVVLGFALKQNVLKAVARADALFLNHQQVVAVADGNDFITQTLVLRNKKV
ncbi:hypothetical protein SDC9_75646 [bioreactor metagenome]|uniref:Uncharacterized protein n=1 Tax=bioreactor metagenome TaxID=1076179 RepID=A0A644YLC2_9ZZZZ